MSKEDWFDNHKNLTVTEIIKLESRFRTDSLVCAVEEQLLQKDDSEEDINESELNVLAVEAMERELNNGGFSQFFENDSWRFTPYFSDSLSSIKAIKTKALVERAVATLGIKPLTDSVDVKDYYQNMQQAIENDEILDKLDELDSEYYSIGEDIAGLLFNYIKTNVDQFK